MTRSPSPKQIVILTQFYPPESTAASNRVAAIARALAAADNDVTVITGKPSFPDGIVPAHYRGREAATESDGRIRIKRVWTYASPRLRSIDRALNWLSVALGATLSLLLRREPVDAVIVSSPPVTLMLPALLGAARHRAQLILDIRDVYPEVAIRLGVWRARGLLARFVAGVSEAAYRRARMIFTVTETCRQEILQHGVAPEKVVTATNGFDRVNGSAERPRLRNNGEFVAAYAGNMGVATGVDVILDAARELAPARNYRFVLVGGGAECAALARRIELEKLENITLLGTQPRDVASAIMREADVCVVPLRRGIVDSLPTKLLDSLAHGTPVIACADGEAREFVERSGGGLAVPPEDGHALAGAIGTLAADPARRRALGQSGLSYVQRHFDRAVIVADVARQIGSLLAS